MPEDTIIYMLIPYGLGHYGKPSAGTSDNEGKMLGCHYEDLPLLAQRWHEDDSNLLGVVVFTMYHYA